VSDVDAPHRARETGAARDLWRSLLAVLLPILIVAMELGVYLSEPRVLSIGNLRNILIQSSYLVLFASAQMVVILTRGFDLSLGASVSAISVASALVMTGLDAGGTAPWIVVSASGSGFSSGCSTAGSYPGSASIPSW
jgi:ribose transport system permease protein